MLSLNAVGVLFPAIPLAIVALNFRYTSLAGLMRELHAQLDKKSLRAAQKEVLYDELAIMARRMNLVKYSLFFLGLSFVQIRGHCLRFLTRVSVLPCFV